MPTDSYVPAKHRPNFEFCSSGGLIIAYVAALHGAFGFRELINMCQAALLSQTRMAIPRAYYNLDPLSVPVLVNTVSGFKYEYRGGGSWSTWGRCGRGSL